MEEVRKAIIPAAGLGKRLLPATMVVPKELIPVGREPMILGSLREIRDAGLSEVAVIMRPQDGLLQEFLFGTPPPEIESEAATEEIQDLLSGLKVTRIDQPEPKGLGDALGRARDYVGNEPFAVLIPDNYFFGKTVPLLQLLPVFQKYRTHITGLISVDSEAAVSFGNCGSVVVEEIEKDIYRILEIGDKKEGYFSIREGDTSVRWYARHIFLPSFFDYLERYGVEKNGEVDDVPVLKAMVTGEEIIGKLLQGKGFDVGNERGLAVANRYVLEEVNRSWK